MKQAFTIGAFAIVTDSENRILLCLRTDADIWNLPGGGIECGEAPWEGVVREVKEETGLDAVVEKLIGVYSKPQNNDLVFSYQCKVVSGVIQINAEAREIAYFNADALPQNIVQKHLERIQDCLANYGDVVMVKQS